MLGRHEHAEDPDFVPPFCAWLARAADDARECTVDEGSVNDVAAVGGEPARALRKGLHCFFLVARREGIGIFGETAQPQRAIRRGVGSYEAADLDFR